MYWYPHNLKPHSVFLFPTYYTLRTSIDGYNTKSHATKQFLMIIRDKLTYCVMTPFCVYQHSK